MKTISSRFAHFLLILISMTLLLGQTSCEKPAAMADQPKEDSVVLQLARINKILVALHTYKSERGSYPVQADWTPYEQGGKDWIPNLVPDYVDSLPNDPRWNPANPYERFLYKSDGQQFKLIIHRGTAMNEIRALCPWSNDPIRPDFAVMFSTRGGSGW